MLSEVRGAAAGRSRSAEQGGLSWSSAYLRRIHTVSTFIQSCEAELGLTCSTVQQDAGHELEPSSRQRKKKVAAVGWRLTHCLGRVGGKMDCWGGGGKSHLWKGQDVGIRSKDQKTREEAQKYS